MVWINKTEFIHKNWEVDRVMTMIMKHELIDQRYYDWYRKHIWYIELKKKGTTQRITGGILSISKRELWTKLRRQHAFRQSITNWVKKNRPEGLN